MIGAGFGIFFAIVVGWIIKAGFIKYFTKVSYRKSIFVSFCMSFVSLFFDFILSIGALLPIAFWLDDLRNMYLSVLVLNIVPAVINTLIDWLVIEIIAESMPTLKLKSPYKWLFVANTIAIAIFFIPWRNFL